MLALSTLASLALFHLAFAQDPSLEIKAIEAHFTQSALVPDLFASFDPSALLSLNYPGVGDVTPGQLLTKEQVGPTPTVTVTPANSSVSLNGTYTLAMVDADIVGAKLAEGQTRHWLVNGVAINGSTVTNSSATAITTYAGPWPAAGSGPHRYVVALYAQPSTFSPPAAFSQSNIGVSAFNFNDYVKSSGLGPLVAATYITVKEGTTAVSISSTSAVVTSTLVPSSSSSSHQAAGTSTGNQSNVPSGAMKTGASIISIISAGAVLAAIAL
ncbi:PEBP-like protein [Agrocybe pediades]|nr:PEBP-like protein [Agrocybe pediades]